MHSKQLRTGSPRPPFAATKLAPFRELLLWKMLWKINCMFFFPICTGQEGVVEDVIKDHCTVLILAFKTASHWFTQATICSNQACSIQRTFVVEDVVEDQLHGFFFHTHRSGRCYGRRSLVLLQPPQNFPQFPAPPPPPTCTLPALTASDSPFCEVHEILCVVNVLYWEVGALFPLLSCALPCNGQPRPNFPPKFTPPTPAHWLQ